MKWISKYPPIYVWKGDEWYCEIDKKTYTCCCDKKIWIDDEGNIKQFPPKTVILST